MEGSPVETYEWFTPISMRICGSASVMHRFWCRIAGAQCPPKCAERPPRRSHDKLRVFVRNSLDARTHLAPHPPRGVAMTAEVDISHARRDSERRLYLPRDKTSAQGRTLHHIDRSQQRCLENRALNPRFCTVPTRPRCDYLLPVHTPLPHLFSCPQRPKILRQPVTSAPLSEQLDQ